MMHRRIASCLACFVLPLVWLTPPACAGDAAGDWHGAIELPGTSLAIEVRLQRDADAWAGSISIPAQMIRGYALSFVTVEGERVAFAMTGIPGEPTFDGAIDADGSRITGTLSQGGASFPFTLARGAPAKADGMTPDRGVPGEGVIGHWQGALRVGPMELRLVLHVERDLGGDLRATLDSLDQGAFAIPIDRVALKGSTVTLASDRLRAAYTGEMDGDGSRIVGTWTQAAALPLTWLRLAEKPVPRRPQEPADPLPYDAVEVTIPHENAGISLAGTLTLPRGDPLHGDRHPAVILISGSGPQDRDETVMGHRPFFVLADDLTRRGVAVLRYDDRGVGRSQGDFSKAVQADFVSDAHAALAFLRTRGDIDPARLGVIGHSEGGLVAPRVAAEDGRVAFIVLIAGVGVPMDQLLDRQVRDMLALAGAPPAFIDEQVALRRQLEQLARERGDTPEARAAAKQLLLDSLGDMPAPRREALGVTDESIAAQLAVIFTPWYEELSRYDPRPWLARVACPVLAVNGDLDVQVAADDNLEAIRAALASGLNPPAAIVKLPGLNHLLQPATTGGIHEYARIETTIDPAALDTIGRWIVEQVQPH